jgi:PhzF family phenazine biosynthesis protein
VTEVLRYVAFSADPAGGNPAGVVLDARGLEDELMQAIAADVGFSETAFVDDRGDGTHGVRYFSPLAEVPFCGHATIATAVAHAERHGTGTLQLLTKAGEVSVSTEVGHGQIVATLTSVSPRVAQLADEDLATLLTIFDWDRSDLDPALPPRVAYAGAWHPILAADLRGRLADLEYNVAALTTFMAHHEWTTINLIWRESATVFHARNPFPPGGVFEDPATGAAAAALGGYLRELALVDLPATLTIHQGDDMGRPGILTVGVSADPGSGIRVSGTAVALPDA